VRRAGEPQAEALRDSASRVGATIARGSSVIADTMRSPSANLKYFCAGSPYPVVAAMSLILMT